MNLAIDRRLAQGHAGRAGSVADTIVTYASTIDTGLTALRVRLTYAAGQRNRIPLLVHHQFTGSLGDFGAQCLARFAGYGFFVITPDLRGGGSSPGSIDLGAREVHDAWDAMAYVRANHADKIHPTRASCVGYSDGGEKTIATLTKFPDLCGSYVDHFGISSYADWYPETSSLFRGVLDTAIGGSPATYPNRYAARDPRAAVPYILNLRANDQPAPHLQTLHDMSDATVTVHHTQDVVSLLSRNYRARYTSNAEPANQRANHGSPGPDSSFSDDGVTYCERYWVPRALSTEAWLMPPRGTVLVKGFLRSVLGWSVWLGPNDGSNPKTGSAGGQEQVALVDYDIPARTFTVTPSTGAMRVRCEIGAGSQTSAGVSSATTITVP